MSTVITFEIANDYVMLICDFFVCGIASTNIEKMHKRAI